MKYFLIAVTVFFAFTSFGANKDTIPANHPLIEYTGRIDFSDSLVPKFSFSGISIRANFSGSSIAAILDDDQGQNYYNVVLNGEVINVINVTKGKKEYVLAEGLSAAMHEIELFKRTELTFGKTQFHGFLLDQGDSLTSITNNREHFIEYIGNSITCGYGNEGKNGDDFLATTENHYLSYAAITSRNFNARHMAVSRSGIGVYRNYDGPATGNDDCMPNLYNRVFLYDENPVYDFAVQPDLVCINLGTNDFSTSGADSALYVNNYFRLIDSIQSKYDQPDIICLAGSMMSGGTLTTLKSYLEFIAVEATKKDKGRVTFFEMSAQKGDLGIGVHYHPTVAQHHKNAMELTNYIKTLKGWKIEPLVVDANTLLANDIVVKFNTELNSNSTDKTGFSIMVEDKEQAIDKVYPDETDSKILHIILKEKVAIEKAIILNYTPGTIESADGTTIGKLTNLKITNTLTATKVNSSKTTSDGTGVKFTMNKKLNPESLIDGLSIMVNETEVAIESFSIATKYLDLVLNTEIKTNDVVTASYNGTGLRGDDEVQVEAFINTVVENKSIITVVPEFIEQTINIYPNPSDTGVFYYQFNETKWGQLVSNYEVVNSAGEIVKKGVFLDAKGQIDLSKETGCGIYFIQFYQGLKSHSCSLMIN